ncbi:MAG TPA: nucleoside/nucleotide kinase family protein [Kineosporiaceae bacterium]|nr:nucleoside/nucleotide kinase family protein [Kineosporiaceae bacterium]
MEPTLDDLTKRVADLLADAPAGTRVIIGIAGTPAAGKTTLAELLVADLGAELGVDQVSHVPMDGYHLADVALERLGLRDRKGAPATFDVYGYLALLRRLRDNSDPVIYAPGFDREIEQPIAGSIAVPQHVRVIITEGNYLLLDGPWTAARDLLDEIWYCRPTEALRLERLLSRHVRFGKTPEAALAWIAQSDAPNADVIASTAERADLEILID